MKLLIRVFTALSLLGLLVGSADAQTTINSTTLSAAVAAADTVVTVGSITCTSCTFGPGTVIFVDLEVMTVAGSWVSGATNIPVIRTNQRANHVNAAVVYIGPPNRFQRIDPPIGTCNKFVYPFYPWLNISNGYEWLCDNGQNAYTAVTWRALIPYQLVTIAASR